MSEREGPKTMMSLGSIPKLTRENFQSWKSIVEIHLTLQGWIEAVETDSVEPRINLQAKLMLLETMDESHRAQVRGCESAKDVMDRLKLIYADNSAANKFRLLQKYYRLTKDPSDSMSEHVGKLDLLRLQLQDLGEIISEEVYQVTLIGSLPQEYGSMLETWELTHEDNRKTANLVARLLQREEDLKNTVKPSHQVLNVRRKPTWQDIEERKKMTNCARCKQIGHWKRECTAVIDEKGVIITAHKTNSDAIRGSPSTRTNVVREELNFMVAVEGGDLKEAWILDSGASSNISNDERWFSSISYFEKPKQNLAADGRALSAIAMGSIPLVAVVNGKPVSFVLDKVLLIPELTTNIISAGWADRAGYKVTIENGMCSIDSGPRSIARGKMLQEGLYKMDFESKPTDSVYLLKHGKTMKEYHDMLGHASAGRIKRTLQRLGKPVPLDTDITCHACPEGKGTRVSHPSVNRLPSEVGTIVVDLAYSNKTSLEGYKLYMIGKDVFSEFVFVYCLNSKAEVPSKLARLILDFEYLSGQTIREIHSDNGSEFVNQTNTILFQKEKIMHFTSSPYVAQQNGRAEREVRTIGEGTRVLLMAAGFTEELRGKLWPEAMLTLAYLKNRMSTTREEASPFERLTGKCPTLDHVVEFGTQAKMINNKDYLKKWDPRTTDVYVVGYTERRNTYRVYLPKSDKVIKSCDLIFAPHRREEPTEKNIPTEQTVPVMRMIEQRGKEGEEKGSTMADISIDSSFLKSLDNCEVTSRISDAPTLGPVEPPSHDETPAVREELSPVFGRNGKRFVTNYELEEFFTPYTRPQTDNREDQDYETGRDGASDEDGPPAFSDRRRTFIIQEEGDNLKSAVPCDYSEAVKGPNSNYWMEAISDELEAHRENGTWIITEKPSTGVSLSTKWVFTLKRDPKGQIERYKARLVAKGYKQRAGVDYDDTFAPVVSIDALRTILAWTVLEGLQIVQFDISTAFLNGTLKEEILVEPPEGVKVEKGKCLRLVKSLYGLKQAPKCWNSAFDSALRKLDFRPTSKDPCVYHRDGFIILIYVDDGLVIGPTKIGCEEIVNKIGQRFRLKLLSGEMFLGLEIKRSANKLTLSQAKYVHEMLVRFNMLEANPVSSPMVGTKDLLETEDQCNTFEGPYREAIGCLQYLAGRTRPDILFAVHLLSRFNNRPTTKHWTAVKRVFGYLKGTPDVGLTYECEEKPNLIAYSDANWATFEDERFSTGGSILTLAGGPIIFRSNKQDVIAQSSTEAEYIAASETTKDILFVHHLLDEIGRRIEKTKLVVDNKSTIHQIKNNDNKRRSRHIEVRYHFIRFHLARGLFELVYVPSENQLADQLTKPLSGPQIQKLNQLSNIKVSTNSFQEAKNPDSDVMRDAAVLGRCLFMAILISGATTEPPLIFEEVAPLLWRETHYKVQHGARGGTLMFNVVSPCELMYQKETDPEAIANITIVGLKQRCLEDYRRQMDPALMDLTSCMRKRRTKRFIIDPISWAAIGGVTLVAGGGAYSVVYSYLSSSSSHNRLNEKDISDKQRDEDVKALKDSLIRAHANITALQETAENTRALRHELIEMINGTKTRLTQLAYMAPNLAYDASRMHHRIASDAFNIKRLSKSCRKGRFDIAAIGLIGNITDYEDIEPEDTDLIEVVTINKSTFLFKFWARLESPDTTIYEAAPFSVWENLTETQPVLMKYSGPLWMIHNLTSNCSRGISEPSNHGVYDSCTIENYRDPRLDSWSPVPKESVPEEMRPRIYETSQYRHIYCMFDTIKIQGTTRKCPYRPFRLPIGISFETGNMSHKVLLDSSQLESSIGDVPDTLIKGKQIDLLSKESYLIEKLIASNEKSIAKARLGWQEGTLVVPGTNLVTLMFGGALIGVMIGGSICLARFCSQGNGPAAGQPGPQIIYNTTPAPAAPTYYPVVLDHQPQNLYDIPEGRDTTVSFTRSGLRGGVSWNNPERAQRMSERRGSMRTPMKTLCKLVRSDSLK